MSVPTKRVQTRHAPSKRVAEAAVAAVAGRYIQTGTIGVGSGPAAVTIAPDGRSAYVANHTDNSVSVFDTSSLKVTDTIGVEGAPYRMAITPDGAFVYVLLSRQVPGQVVVIDTATKAVSNVITVGDGGGTGLAMAPDGKRAYVPNAYGRTISVIDTDSQEEDLDAEIILNLDDNGVWDVAVTADGLTLYATCTLGPVFVEIDVANKAISKVINLDSEPRGIAIAPGGSVYVANITEGLLSVIDIASDTVTKTPDVGRYPSVVAVSPDGSLAFVPDGDNAISVIDTATNSVTYTIPVGQAPRGVAIVPNGGRVFVANSNAQTVSVLEQAVAPADTSPVFTSPRLTTGVPGDEFAFTISVAGKPVPSLSTPTRPGQATTPGADRLPKGLSLNTATAPFGLTGTVDSSVSPGDYSVVVKADNGVGSASTQTLTVTIAHPVEITGTIDGSVAPGAYAVDLAATNGVDPDAAQTLTITVTAPRVAPVFTSAKAALVSPGGTLKFPITVTGNPAPILSAAAAATAETTPGQNRFPKGLTLNTTTLPYGLAGTVDPSVGQGSYTFDLSATNGVGAAVTQRFTVTVASPARRVAQKNSSGQSVDRTAEGA